MAAQQAATRPFPTLPFDIFAAIAESLALPAPSANCHWPDIDTEDPSTGGVEADTLPWVTDRHAVIMLSSTCKSLRDLFARYCFYGLTIDMDPKGNAKVYNSLSMIKLKALFGSHPEIGRHVRSLVCKMYDFVLDDDLTRIAQTLVRLDTLLVMDSDCLADEPTTNWDRVPKAFHAALQTLMELPTLRTLRVGNIANFPIHHVFSSQSLQSLQLAGSSLAPIGDEHRLALSNMSVKLEKIILEPGGYSAASLIPQLLRAMRCNGIPFFDFSNSMESITIEIDNEEELQLETCLDSLRNLKSLVVGYYGDHSKIFNRIFSEKAPSLAALRHLTLQQFPPVDSRERGDYLLPFRLLKDIPTLPLVEDIRLHLYFPQHYIHVDAGEGKALSDLRNLDKLVCTRSRFPSLNSVAISVEIVCHCRPGEEQRSMDYRMEMYKDVWEPLPSAIFGGMQNLESFDWDVSVVPGRF